MKPDLESVAVPGRSATARGDGLSGHRPGRARSGSADGSLTAGVACPAGGDHGSSLRAGARSCSQSRRAAHDPNRQAAATASTPALHGHLAGPLRTQQQARERAGQQRVRSRNHLGVPQPAAGCHAPGVCRRRATAQRRAASASAAVHSADRRADSPGCLTGRVTAGQCRLHRTTGGTAIGRLAAERPPVRRDAVRRPHGSANSASPPSQE